MVNGVEITLDERLLNGTTQAITVNNSQLLISAYRPTPDDEVGKLGAVTAVTCKTRWTGARTGHITL